MNKLPRQFQFKCDENSRISCKKLGIKIEPFSLLRYNEFYLVIDNEVLMYNNKLHYKIDSTPYFLLNLRDYVYELNITPKEKAQELIDKMSFETHSHNAKYCALIAVDELIIDNNLNEELVNGGLNKQYWEEVRKEIENL